MSEVIEAKKCGVCGKYMLRVCWCEYAWHIGKMFYCSYTCYMKAFRHKASAKKRINRII